MLRRAGGVLPPAVRNGGSGAGRVSGQLTVHRGRRRSFSSLLEIPETNSQYLSHSRGDLNRPEGRRQLFSAATRDLSRSAERMRVRLVSPVPSAGSTTPAALKSKQQAHAARVPRTSFSVSSSPPSPYQLPLLTSSLLPHPSSILQSVQPASSRSLSLSSLQASSYPLALRSRLLAAAHVQTPRRGDPFPPGTAPEPLSDSSAPSSSFSRSSPSRSSAASALSSPFTSCAFESPSVSASPLPSSPFSSSASPVSPPSFEAGPSSASSGSFSPEVPDFLLPFLPSTVGRDRLRRQSDRISTRAALVRRASRLSHVNLTLAIHQLSLEASAAARHAAIAAVQKAIVADRRPTPPRDSVLSYSAAESSNASPSIFTVSPSITASVSSASTSSESPDLAVPRADGFTGMLSTSLIGTASSRSSASSPCSSPSSLPSSSSSSCGLETRKLSGEVRSSPEVPAEAVQVWGELKELDREEEVSLWRSLLGRLEEIEASVTSTEQVILLDALSRLPPQLLSTCMHAQDQKGAASVSSPALFRDLVLDAARRLMTRLVPHVSELPLAALAIVLRASAVLDLPHSGLLAQVSARLQMETNLDSFQELDSERRAALGPVPTGGLPSEEREKKLPEEETQRAQGGSSSRREGLEGRREMSGNEEGERDQDRNRGRGERRDSYTERGDGTWREEAEKRERSQGAARDQKLGGRGICAVVYGHLALASRGFTLDPTAFLLRFLSPQVCATLSPTHAAALATYSRLCLESQLAESLSASPSPPSTVSENACSSGEPNATSHRATDVERDVNSLASPSCFRDTRQLDVAEWRRDRSRLLLRTLRPLLHRLLQIQSGCVSPTSASSSSSRSRAASSSLFSSLLSLSPASLNQPWYTHTAFLQETEEADKDSATVLQTPCFASSLFSPHEEAAAAAFACTYLASFLRLGRQAKDGACVSDFGFDACTEEQQSAEGWESGVHLARGGGTQCSVARQTGDGETAPEGKGDARKVEAGARGAETGDADEMRKADPCADVWGVDAGAEESFCLLKRFTDALPTVLGRIGGADAAALFSALHRIGCLDSWTAEALADVMERELNRLSLASQRYCAPWGERRPGLPAFWNEERLVLPVLLRDSLHFLEEAVAVGTLCRRRRLLQTLAGESDFSAPSSSASDQGKEKGEGEKRDAYGEDDAEETEP
ncbi:hypothetical protein TGVAND_233490 [Toxoplasma gondii VAND]|uniref:Uncharacterized protein n=1 Tax=Toxoplasma gondii VAND TaxID=933077 RepID=A0A086QFM6_TOXGO|nr:hypothetical protein TGVAND_233490 [Toxoplasma gondii VAND]